jgi:hypothetical protein
MKTNITMKGQELLNLKKRTDKHSESSTELAVNIQILKQQKQLNGRKHHVPLNINTEWQWIQLSHQNTLFCKLD